MTSASAENIVVETADGTHFWSDFANADVYGESGGALARFQDGEGASSLDQISVASGSPSQPTIPVSISDPGNAADDAFLDVMIDYTP